MDATKSTLMTSIRVAPSIVVLATWSLEQPLVNSQEIRSLPSVDEKKGDKEAPPHPYHNDEAHNVHAVTFSLHHRLLVVQG